MSESSNKKLIERLREAADRYERGDPEGKLLNRAASALEEREGLEAEAVAKRFHDAYERLAPGYGYKTREASAVPWEDVPEQNKMLMIATVEAALNPSPIEGTG